MRTINKSIPTARILLATAVFGLFLAPALAQKAAAPAAPKYDVKTETKIKGIIQEVKPPANGGAKESIHLLVKTTEEVVDVTLCPKSYLDDMGVTLAKDDEVSLTISKIKQDGVPDVVLARDVAKGEDKVILRDEKGAPAWIWKH